MYDGHCRNLTNEQRKMQERQPSWRIRIEKETEESFHDLLRGDATQRLKPCEDDFVVMRADGQIAYQLAVSCDDGAMGITHVFRGEDLFSSTFYQIAILKELGYPLPVYAHLPLLMDQEGNRLSKDNMESPSVICGQRELQQKKSLENCFSGQAHSRHRTTFRHLCSKEYSIQRLQEFEAEKHYSQIKIYELKKQQFYTRKRCKTAVFDCPFSC